LKSYANVLDHASNDSQFEPRTVSQNLTSTPSPPLVRWWPSSILQRCMGSTNAEACPGEIAFRALPQQRGNNNCYGYVLPYVIVPANSNDTLTDTLLHPSPSSPFLALHPPLLAPPSPLRRGETRSPPTVFARQKFKSWREDTF
ncbi:hypothetical protein CLAIMM_07695 isoform 5, partial [Cladophialophora immunda]